MLKWDFVTLSARHDRATEHHRDAYNEYALRIVLSLHAEKQLRRIARVPRIRRKRGVPGAPSLEANAHHIDLHALWGRKGTWREHACSCFFWDLTSQLCAQRPKK